MSITELNNLQYLRPEVLAFAFIMEDQLREHDESKGKRGWKNQDPALLAERVVDEAVELIEAVRKCRKFNTTEVTNAVYEASDVANMAMMVVDTFGRLPLELAKKLIHNEVISENIRSNFSDPKKL